MNRTRIVPHHNTVFRQLTNHLPMAELDRLVAQHRADKGVRKLPTKGLLMAMLFAQLSGARSLRDIEAFLANQDARRYHSGLPVIRRATLADAAARRPVEVFSGVLAALIPRVTRPWRRGVGQCVRLIDSTTLRLSSLAQGWARFSADLCGAKAHIVYDPDAACRIVTSLKINTPIEVIQTLSIAQDADNILSDQIGYLPQRLARSRQNPMQNAIREIKVRIQTGKVLRILTNDLDAPATEIATLYKRRWDIELFFRWIKQTLKLRHFYGTSERAVRIQIIVALIAFTLIKLAHAAQTAVESLTRFGRLIHANTLHRQAIHRMGPNPPPPPPVQSNAQRCLFET